VKKKVYVIGHKNPDTDSVCSAIVYASLKNEISEIEHEPLVQGPLKQQTEYVLNRFGIKKPRQKTILDTVARDIMSPTVLAVNKDDTIKQAGTLLVDRRIRSAPVVDNRNKLTGMLTEQNFANFYLMELGDKHKRAIEINLAALVQTLNGQPITSFDNNKTLEARIFVGAMNLESLLSYITNNDVLVIGNRWDTLKKVLNTGVGAVVLSGGHDIPADIVAIADGKNVPLIKVDYDTYKASRLIAMCVPVRKVMNRSVVSLDEEAGLEEIKKTLLDHKYSIPVVDKQKHVIGILSRSDLINRERKKVILVDHNEKSQSLDNIDDVDVVEILDHHRIGNVETLQPILMLCHPVGCTATLVLEHFDNHKKSISASYAALLFAAIISDTQIFKSPTTTERDRKAADRLAEIANLCLDDFAMEVFSAGLDIKNRSLAELLYQDFKESAARETRIGIGQVELMSFNDISPLKERMPPFLRAERVRKKLNLVALAFTNIMKEETLLFFDSDDPTRKQLALARKIFDNNNHFVLLPETVSRKKQILPLLVRPFL
jgi:manganese-dependent inorganic pyrophosphatase